MSIFKIPCKKVKISISPQGGNFQFSVRAERYVKSIKARIHCEIFLSDYLMKYNLMHIPLRLIWFHEIHKKYVKSKPPQTTIWKTAMSSCLLRLHVVEWLTCFSWKGCSHGRLFFSQIILPEIKTVSFSIEFRCYCAKNKFRTGTLCRIFSYGQTCLLKKLSAITRCPLYRGF